jgi:hypothetical protein
MAKNYGYTFDDESGILYKNYFGDITIEDIIASWEDAFEHHRIPKNTHRFILDYRQASIRIKSTKHTEISDFYKQHPEFFKNARIAVVTHDPKDTVVTILVHEKDDGYYSLPFSTVEAAREWVLSE